MNKRVIEVLTDEEIKIIYIFLWTVYRNSKISRREFLRLLSCLHNDIVRLGIRVEWPESGEEYEFPDLDDLIDPEGRWYSNYVQRADKGYEPRYRSKKYELLRLMMLYLEVHHPRIAQLVRKPLRKKITG